MNDPDAVSLRELNLMAPDGLACPAGGTHHIKENKLIQASRAGGGIVRCEKCGEDVELRSLLTL